MASVRTRCLYAVYLLFIFILSVEILTRLFLKDAVSVLVNDERSLTYEYHPLLGWFPQASSDKEFVGSRRIRVVHNTEGFRDKEHGPKKKPRILFLGDSFVWGYDVEPSERFTEKLQERLPHFELLNLGVSGYGTDQEFLLLQKEFDRYQPDLVFLLFSSNDRRDNSSDLAYGFGKPYFEKRNGGLALKGVPPRKSTVYFLKTRGAFLRKSVFLNLALLTCEKLQKHRVPDPTEDLVAEMDTYLRTRKVNWVVVLVDSDERLMNFSRGKGIPTVDLSGIGPRYRFLSHGNHWTGEGHRIVSDALYDFLRRNDFFHLVDVQ